MTGLCFLIFCIVFLAALLLRERPEWIFVTSPDDPERAPRCRLLRSHAYGRPFTEGGRRVQECGHCGHVAPFVWNVPVASRATQETIDGGVAVCAAVLDRETTAEITRERGRAAVAQKTREKFAKKEAAA